MPGAVKFPGLVKSRGLVVGSVDPGQRRQYRGLVLAVPQAARTAGRQSGSTSGIELMLLLCAAYVFGCAFRSFLPRADVQRICLFDTWLSSVVVGRSVATVAEICFAAQWAIVLHQLGTMTGADTTLNAAWVIVPLILIAECFSWYAVLTTNYLRQRHRKFDMGRRLLHRRRSAFAGCCRSSMVRFAWSSSSRSSGLPPIWRFS